MHRTNRRIFAQIDDAHPLLRLYLHLVALEITLKDGPPPLWQYRHDVVSMLNDRGKARLDALATQLNDCLARLSCTSTKGVAVHVRPQNYPEIRYLRFAEDHAIGASDEAVLREAAQVTEDIYAELKLLGVTPC